MTLAFPSEGLRKVLAPLGRAGAVVMVAGAVGAVVGGAWLILEVGPWNGTTTWSPAGVGMGLFLWGAAAWLAFEALRLLVKGAPKNPKLSDDVLRALLSENRPMVVCLECRAEVLVAPCDWCRQSSSCFEVRTEADRENARVLLGLVAAPPLSP